MTSTEHDTGNQSPRERKTLLREEEEGGDKIGWLV